MNSLTVVKRIPAEAEPRAVTFSPDGQRLAIGDKNGHVAISGLDGKIEWEFDVGRAVVSLAWSPDGRWLAIGSRGELQVIDSHARRQIHSEESTSMYVLSVAWSPENTLSWDASVGVGLWNPVQGGASRQIELGNQVFATAWSSGGRLAVGLSNGAIYFLEGNQRTEFARQSGIFYGLAWSPDDRKLAATNGGGHCKIWETSTGSLNLENAEFGNATRLSWITNDLLAAANNTEVFLFRISTQQKINSWASPGFENTIAYSAANGLLGVDRKDGVYLLDVSEFVEGVRRATASNVAGYVELQMATISLRPRSRIEPVWVPHLPEASADCLGCLRGQHSDGGGPSIVFSPDKTRLLVGNNAGTLRAYSLKSGLEIWQKEVKGGDDLSLSPDRQQIATLSDFSARGLSVLDSKTGALFWSVESARGSRVRWSPDGTRVVTARGEIYSARSGELLIEAEGNFGEFALDILSDGRILCEFEDALQVCDSDFGLLKTITQIKHPKSIAISPLKDLVAVGCNNGQIWICNLPSLSPVAHWEDLGERVTDIAWSPGGEYIAASFRSAPKIGIWKVTDGSLFREFEFPEQYAWRLAWSPQGGFLAAGISGDTVRFFDTRLLFPQPSFPSNPAAFPSVEHLALVRRLTQFHRLDIHPPLSTLASSPDALLAAEHGIQLLSTLSWTGAARSALDALLLREVPFEERWRPPSEHSRQEISKALLQGLADADPISSEAPPYPLALVKRAAQEISEPFVRVLDLIGPDAIAEDPSIPLRLLRSHPTLPLLPSPRLWRWSERSFSQQGGHSIAMTSLGDRGGFGPHGDIRSLLLSQWVLPEDVMTYRFLHQELLYRQRLSNAPPRVRPLVVMLDISAATFGAIEAITRPLAHAALNRAYEAGVPASLVLVGASTRVVPIQRRRDFVEIWINRGEPLAAATHGLHTAQRTRETWTTNSEEGIILVLSHAWFGADETLPAIPGLRALFVQYPGAKVTPQFPCEAWHTVDSHQPTTMWAKLAELLA